MGWGGDRQSWGVCRVDPREALARNRDGFSVSPNLRPGASPSDQRPVAGPAVDPRQLAPIRPWHDDFQGSAVRGAGREIGPEALSYILRGETLHTGGFSRGRRLGASPSTGRQQNKPIRSRSGGPLTLPPRHGYKHTPRAEIADPGAFYSVVFGDPALNPAKTPWRPVASGRAKSQIAGFSRATLTKPL